MPWLEMRPMDQKVLFLADYLRGGCTMTALCERYGISRKTGYKWLHRYEEQGIDGLHDQSRAPVSHAAQIPFAVRQAILVLRQKYPVPLGPKKILTLLEQRFSRDELPSKTTVYNILRQEGLIKPRRRRRCVAPGRQPFAPVREVNDVWSVDFKGQFKTLDGHWCYPLTVMDHKSRFLLGCCALEGTRSEPTRQAFMQLFKAFGLPLRIRSDNGVPFASTATAGLSKLSIWWLHLGILPERIEPGKPQQNGQHERMHKTLKQWVRQSPAQSMADQQQELDRFRHFYNYERPHESLHQAVPGQRYEPSPRVYPEQLPDFHYPSYFVVKRVNGDGLVYWGGNMIYVSYLLEGEHIGMEEVADGIWDVYLGPIRLGGFDVRKAKPNSRPYLTVKT